VTTTWVFPVGAAGVSAYVLEAKRPEDLVAGGFTAQMTALFVPFGSSGAATLNAGRNPTRTAPSPPAGAAGERRVGRRACSLIRQVPQLAGPDVSLVPWTTPAEEPTMPGNLKGGRHGMGSATEIRARR
jgi:hypothetical protein